MQNIITNLYNNYYLFLIIAISLVINRLIYLFIKKILKIQPSSSITALSGILSFFIMITIINIPTIVTTETKTIDVKKIAIGQSYTIYDENDNQYVLETSKRIEKGDTLMIRKDYVGKWHLN